MTLLDRILQAQKTQRDADAAMKKVKEHVDHWHQGLATPEETIIAILDYLHKVE